MILGMTRASLIFAVIGGAAMTTSAIAQTSANTAGFLQSNQTATIDCVGGQAAIMGSNNDLTIKGNCTSLSLAGSNNKISIQFAPGAQVSFVGSGNTISWTSTDNKPPKVSYVGSGNTLTPPIQ